MFNIGLTSASDAVTLAHADHDQRVIVSSDSDFGALLARHERVTPSLVLLRHSNDLTADQQADMLVAGLPTVAWTVEHRRPSPSAAPRGRGVVERELRTARRRRGTVGPHEHRSTAEHNGCLTDASLLARPARMLCCKLSITA